LGVRKKVKDELHVMWHVPFEPGTLKAISRMKGKTILSKEIKTAGEPAKMELTADRKLIKADGKDLSFVTVRILDNNNNTVPQADNLIEFSVSGTGTIAGTDNGYQADTVSLKTNKRKCWKGMALVIIKSAEKKGNITLRANSPGLQSAILSIKTGN